MGAYSDLVRVATDSVEKAYDLGYQAGYEAGDSPEEPPTAPDVAGGDVAEPPNGGAAPEAPAPVGPTGAPEAPPTPGYNPGAAEDTGA